jgi:hypothetical protein
MLIKRKKTRGLGVALLAMALAALSFAPAALAHSGEWAKFNNCPSTTTGVFKCLDSVTTGGHVKLGNKNVPIVNPVTLAGGYTLPNAEGVSSFFAAKNGETLSRTAQPVPGGLTGLVNCKEIGLYLLRVSCEGVFENGFTGVNATLELAKPASEIRVSEFGLIAKRGTALKLPVKVHLENPLFGESCYVGSSSSPLIWNLTTGTTTPPAGTTPLSGTYGTASLTEESQIFNFAGAELVENNWAAPHAEGCGGFLFEYLLDPIVDASVGIPAGAGTNEVVLKDNISIALSEKVNLH